MKQRLTDAGYAAGWAAVRGLPEPLARRGFDRAADAVWRRQGKSVQRLTANLRRVLGPEADEDEVQETARAGMRSYLRYWCEAFRLPTLSRDEVLARFALRDGEPLFASVRSGRGAVATLPHTGNWDMAGAWLVASGVPFTTVAERLQPESLFERFVAYREGLGMEVVPLTGGERPPYALLSERLRAGGCLCLLGDRDLTAAGIEVDFFGAKARMPAGPAALAVDTGAALLPVTLSYPDERRCEGQMYPEVPVPAEGTRAEKIAAMTQQVADAFAVGIAAAPRDWHMLQRLWVDDLPPGRRRALARQAVDEAA